MKKIDKILQKKYLFNLSFVTSINRASDKDVASIDFYLKELIADKYNINMFVFDLIKITVNDELIRYAVIIDNKLLGVFKVTINKLLKSYAINISYYVVVNAGQYRKAHAITQYKYASIYDMKYRNGNFKRTHAVTPLSL